MLAPARIESLAQGMPVHWHLAVRLVSATGVGGTEQPNCTAGRGPACQQWSWATRNQVASHLHFQSIYQVLTCSRASGISLEIIHYTLYEVAGPSRQTHDGGDAAAAMGPTADILSTNSMGIVGQLR